MIAEHVRSGRFPTPESVVEEAITMLGYALAEDTLDAEDLAAIAQADADIERGDVFIAEEARAMILGALKTGQLKSGRCKAPIA